MEDMVNDWLDNITEPEMRSLLSAVILDEDVIQPIQSFISHVEGVIDEKEADLDDASQKVGELEQELSDMGDCVEQATSFINKISAIRREAASEHTE